MSSRRDCPACGEVFQVGARAYVTDGLGSLVLMTVCPNCERRAVKIVTIRVRKVTRPKLRARRRASKVLAPAAPMHALLRSNGGA